MPNGTELTGMPEIEANSYFEVAGVKLLMNDILPKKLSHITLTHENFKFIGVGLLEIIGVPELNEDQRIIDLKKSHNYDLNSGLVGVWNVDKPGNERLFLHTSQVGHLEIDKTKPPLSLVKPIGGFRSAFNELLRLIKR